MPAPANMVSRFLQIAALVIVGLFSATPAAAQSSLLIESARAAATKGDNGAVRSLLHQLWLLDSGSVYLLADVAELVFLDGREHPNSAIPDAKQADTLLRIYSIGIARDVPGRGEWLVRRAMLARRLPQFYEKHLRSWALEAIHATSDDCPLYLYEIWAESHTKAYQDLRIPLSQATLDWAVIDRLLLVRELSNLPEGAATAGMRMRLTLQMRSALPDCQMIVPNFQEGIVFEILDPNSIETFLILHELQGCDLPELWKTALSQSVRKRENAWIYRLAAAHAQNRLETAEAVMYWGLASNLEKEHPLKAMDMLQAAKAKASLKAYREARSLILKAMELHPNWGEPYIQLADLYLEGSAECEFSDFDGRALNWLLIDLCQAARNADETYAEEADRRIYAYRKAAPSREEAAFKGLSIGDSWPIRCWMSTSTTVKAP